MSEPGERAAPAAIGVRLLLFGVYREKAGTGERSLRVPAGSRVADLVERLRASPRFAWLPARPVVAVNREYADETSRLEEGDEVALIPPVAGG